MPFLTAGIAAAVLLALAVVTVAMYRRRSRPPATIVGGTEDVAPIHIGSWGTHA
jgi:hypothetical protein